MPPKPAASVVKKPAPTVTSTALPATNGKLTNEKHSSSPEPAPVSLKPAPPSPTAAKSNSNSNLNSNSNSNSNSPSKVFAVKDQLKMVTSKLSRGNVPQMMPPAPIMLTNTRGHHFKLLSPEKEMIAMRFFSTKDNMRGLLGACAASSKSIEIIN